MEADHVDDLAGVLERIEHSIDQNTYRAGPWAAFLKTVRARPRQARLYFADDISRISNKLHLRGGRKTISVRTGVVIAILATIAGLILLELGLEWHSNLVVLATGLIWAVTFEPMFKMLVGTLLGIRFDYFYMFGRNQAGARRSAWREPHAKMRYGTYIALPRIGRILFHLSGMVGTACALWFVAWLSAEAVWLASAILAIFFWVIVALNLALLIAALAGRTRFFEMPVRHSSGGAAALEIRGGISDLLSRFRHARHATT